MIQVTCDKCKNEIIYHPAQQAILPSYMITKISGYNPVGAVNLCPDCEKKFAEWLNGESEE